jgi:hypothetical protein
MIRIIKCLNQPPRGSRQFTKGIFCLADRYKAVTTLATKSSHLTGRVNTTV